MKWVLIDGDHINTDQIKIFCWLDTGRLAILLVGDDNYRCYEDPNKTQYIKLCHVLGVSPDLE